VVCVFSGRTRESGVVSTANYKAREHGVVSGIPIVIAKRKLKGVDAVFIAMEHEKYEEISGRVMNLARAKVDAFEQAGIDEAFFDVTKSSNGDYGRAAAIAAEIKEKIKRDYGLTSSIGLGPNKIVAKIASDYKKPDGLTVVESDEVRAFLGPLNVGKLFGVGVKTGKVLAANRMVTIGELAQANPETLQRLFGKKFGIYLHEAANGVNDDLVAEKGQATQISRIITLKRDTRVQGEIFQQLRSAIKDVSDRVVSRKVTFKSVSVIGVLSDLSIRTKTRTLENSTSDLKVLEENLEILLEELTKIVDKEIRRAGVRVSNFDKPEEQSSLSEFT
jgi:DNA polymerase IV (DinB-like DNA polymerase)